LYIADSADIQYLTGADVEAIRRSSALFLLKLKEKRRTSQVCIDDIVEGSRGLFHLTVDRVGAGIKSHLAESGVDQEFIAGLDRVIIVDPFHGIDTCHLQEKYFHESLGLIVSVRVWSWEHDFTSIAYPRGGKD
jgi:hypothetical protein